MTPEEFKTARARYELGAAEVAKQCTRLKLPGWTAKIDAAPRRRLGQCRYTKKEIGFSLAYILNCSEDSVVETAKHEVAHALAYVRASHTGHGDVWVAACEIVGAKPIRCADVDEIQTVLAATKHPLFCPTCDKIVGALHRTPSPKKFYRCTVCNNRVEVRSA